MYINIVFLMIISAPSVVDVCDYQLTNTTGTIVFPSYSNNIECIWLFNLSTLVNANAFRALTLTFHHFDTEFGHDELLIGETIADVSRYNSKLFRFSGSKLPEPCVIPLRGDPLLRPIWMQFVSDRSTTGSGFTLDYAFLGNQSLQTTPKSPKVLINADIRHPSDGKFKTIKLPYSYPYGNISSPNYPQEYPNNIICRWHLFHRHACIRLLIDTFESELHYDTLTVYLGQNLNNRAMILYEWSGNELDNRHLFIPNDNVYLVFQTDKTNNASGFSLRYEIIEKEMSIVHVDTNEGVISSSNYPRFLRTNSECTWVIRTNDTNQIEINLLDSDLDVDHDHLQVITGELLYTLDTLKSYRVHTTNETKLVLRTKHSDDDYRYRGFNLTYRKSNARIDTNDHLSSLPCGRKFSWSNGTIEFQHRTFTSFDCLILIEVDDGQNIFLRFDQLDWDPEENYMEIGLLHNPNEFRIFHISDTIPGTWFIANDSQIWIRFYSSQFSLNDVCSFRLFYSETIQWSTVSPKPYLQVLDDHRLFPYRLISLPTHSIYHNLTQAYMWQIEALDDECVQVRFEALQAIDDRRICFQVKDALRTSRICSNQPFPFVYHHVGPCVLSIEPDFAWMLVKYNLQINTFKKMTLVHYLTFHDDNITITPSMPSESYIHIEWHLSLNESSTIIFDIENFDGKTPAELILPQTGNTTKRYSLGTILATRFGHVLSSSPSSTQITYTSLPLPIAQGKRSFRLNLYKLTQSHFTLRDFHYISYKTNQSDWQWSIQGQYEHSIFLAKLFSTNKNLALQTTANVHLSAKNSAVHIPTSSFDMRYNGPKNITSNDFIVILYEQREMNLYRHVTVNRTSSVIETNDFALYDIHLQSTAADSIDFVLIKGDNGTFIRVYDLNARNNGYFRLNLSSTSAKQLFSPVGLRFSIRSLHIKIELQSLRKTPIQLRYKSHIRGNHSCKQPLATEKAHAHCCLITSTNACHGNTTLAGPTCIDSCSTAFDHISPSMNNTGGHRFWPYALRGSVTLVIENTTIDNFEKAIYRQLRYSLAKIVRKFCAKYEPTCLSKDTDSIRADHVIIQSYEEESADQRLFVAIFIKDPYRQAVALSNDQFLLALKRYRQDIYDDIKHHIQLPTNILEHSSLDPIWLYGICLLVLLVLIVILLILILILAKKTFCSSSPNPRTNKSAQRITPERDQLIISSPMRLATEEDEQISTTCYNETDTSQASNFTVTASLLPPTVSTTYPHRPINRPSYFNSNIESAIKQRLDNDDSEPIPFIDDNLSIAHSRKSSACWSDRTSLSSRFSLAWKLHSRRSGSHNRSTISSNHEKRRKYHHRPLRYTLSAAQQNQPNDEL